MSAKTERKIKAAKRAADALRAAGDHFHAEQVLALCRSHEIAVETLSRLWADNQRLRCAAGEPALNATE